MMRLPDVMFRENLPFFIEFMLSQIDRILEDISLQINEENEQFSETVRKSA